MLLHCLTKLKGFLSVMSDSVTRYSKTTKRPLSAEKELMSEIARKAKEASSILSVIDTGTKNKALYNIAQNLRDSRKLIIEGNIKDIDESIEKGVSKSLADRLKLDDNRISSMAAGIEQIAALKDPVGEIINTWKRPNGLTVGKMRIPLGVIGIIYEARPNVTADAAALCLKAGNSVILRGGSEAIRSNRVIGDIIRESITTAGLPAGCVQIVPVTDRKAVLEMLKLDDMIDLIIPRGGEGLIRFVSENSSIPVLKHYKGVCHVYVDEHADLDMARKIAFNSKVQRPGVCNAMETLLVNSNLAPGFLPLIAKDFKDNNVLIKGCEKTCDILNDIEEAEDKDWYEEYLDLIVNIKVVSDMQEAIQHIERYGSMHTDSIVTDSYQNATFFISRVCSSAVMVNASTRFNDGYELGLGAEIGISTTKLHAFGPMGVDELTTTKFIVVGNGQIKQ